MRDRRLASVILCAAVLCAACNSSGDAGGSDPGTGPGSSTATPGAPATLGPEGGGIEFDTGPRIEAFAGSFTAEATVTAVPSETDDLPPGLAPIGESWSITSTVPPSGPILIGLPLPDDADPDEVAMLHTAADGTQELLGGFAEDGTYYAATRGFSDYRLVGRYLQDVMGWGSEEELPFNLGAPIETEAEPPEAGTLLAEYGGLVRGTIEAPRLRRARLYGPGEVAVGEETTFTVTGFETIDPRFLQYSWSVAGTGLSIESSSTKARIVASGDSPGRALVMVEVTDPYTGARTLASRRVFVTEGTLTVSAIALGSPYYADGDGPVVTCAAFGGTPPYRWEWAWSDGSSGTSDVASPRITHSPIGSDRTLNVVVTDSADVEAAATIAVQGLPYRSGTPAVMLSGPLEGTVGEELVYKILKWQPEGSDEIGTLWVTTSGGDGAATVAGDEVRATFGAPGLKGIIIEGSSSLIYAATGVRIMGESLPYEAEILGLPDQAIAGAPVAFEVGARGGIVDIETTGYDVVVDFGDGEQAGLVIPATTAVEWSSIPVEHTWQEPGLHQVVLQVFDGLTELARVTLNVEVLADHIAAVGQFWTPDPEDFPFPFEVTENRIRIVIEANEVRIPRFALTSVYVPWSQFELGSGETSEPTCAQHSETTLDSFQGAYDPATGIITGTGVVMQHTVDIGTDCPFGGIDKTDMHPFELEATLTDGLIAGRFQYTESEGGLTFEATVRPD